MTSKLTMGDYAMQLADLHTRLGFEDAQAVKIMAVCVAEFIQTKDKKAKVRDLVGRYGQMKREDGRPLLSGLTEKSLYRKAQQFVESGYRLEALMDGRQIREATACGLGDNVAFMEYWGEMVLRNARKTGAAVKELYRRLQEGEVVAGIGDWEDIYEREFGRRPTPGSACPFALGVNEPKGLSKRNLMRLKPSKYIVDAMRKGNMAAAMDNLPQVHHTKVGMPCCAALFFDDYVLEHKTRWGGKWKAQRVTGFDLMDAKTHMIVATLMKPVIEGDDGKRKYLKAKWGRYLIAHLIYRIGIPETGTCILGEHGTASLDKATLEQIKEATGGLIDFGAGGRFTKPLAPGLLGATPHGNPRFKSPLEEFHAPLKNILAAVKGQMGGGRGKEPEWVKVMDQQDAAIGRLVEANANAIPGLRQAVQGEYLPYGVFAKLVMRGYSILMNRHDHDIGEWDELGFVRESWRLSANDVWHTPAEWDALPSETKAQLQLLRDNGSIQTKAYRMSPNEAYLASADEHKVTFPAPVAMLVMGQELAVACRCQDNLELKYRDEDTFMTATVYGILQDGTILERGKSYLVWINPCEPNAAFVADLYGRYIGLAKVAQDVRWNDFEGAKKAAGIRFKAQAAEVRKAMPILARIGAGRQATLAGDLKAITGADPYETHLTVEGAREEIEKTEAADIEFGGEAFSGDEAADIDVGYVPEADSDDINPTELI